MTVRSAPGYNMEHYVSHQEVWKTGKAIILVNGQRKEIPYNFRTDFALVLLDSNRLSGCIPTPIAVLPTPTVTNTPVPLTPTPTVTNIPVLPTVTALAIQSSQIEATRQAIEIRQKQIEATQTTVAQHTDDVVPSPSQTVMIANQVGPYWQWRKDLGGETLMLNILSIGHDCLEPVVVIVDGKTLMAAAISDTNDPNFRKDWLSDYWGIGGTSCNYLTWQSQNQTGC